MRWVRRRRLPLSPPPTLRGVSVGLLPQRIPRCLPRGPGLHAGFAARIAPSDCSSAGLRWCAVTNAGGCRFPPSSAPHRVFVELLQHCIPRCPPRGLGLHAGIAARLSLRTAAARARAGAPCRRWRLPLSPQSTLPRVSVELLPPCIPGWPPRGLGLHAGIAAAPAPGAALDTGGGTKDCCSFEAWDPVDASGMLGRRGAVISELRRCACGPTGLHPHLHPHGAGVASAMQHRSGSRIGMGLPGRPGRAFSPPHLDGGLLCGGRLLELEVPYCFWPAVP